MPIWMTVYCRKPLSDLTPQQVLDGIQGNDPVAPAGVDYWTLAEDYGIDEDLVDEELSTLSVSPLRGGDEGYEVRYGAREQPLAIRRWHDPTRVAEEIQEILEQADRQPEEAIRRVHASREVIGVEMRPGHLRDMGVVIAYEVARYLAQKGDGLIRTDEERWLEVKQGAFEPLE